MTFRIPLDALVQEKTRRDAARLPFWLWDGMMGGVICVPDPQSRIKTLA
jgi:hypothetical protein